jgi:type VI secretion system protein ImpA
MSAIDVEELLEPISLEAPCGEDLAYDPAFQEMLRTAEGQLEQRMGDSVKPAVEPDWRRTRALALGLFSRTKDIRVSVMLARALLHTDGLAGLSSGLMLTRRLTTDFWDCAYPQLDPDDGNDPTERVNSLLDLCGLEPVLTPLRTIPLVHSRVFGPVSVRDVEVAEGKAPPPTESAAPPMDMANVTAAFLDCELEELRGTAAALVSALNDVETIQSFVNEQVSASEAPDLAPLAGLLKEATTLVQTRLQERNDQATSETTAAGEEGKRAEPVNSAGSPSEPPSQRMSGDIHSREDVVRVLDRLCDYYARSEPSSPVPLLLQRARRLATKDFMEIVRDLAPDAVSQIETIRGPDSEP